jgi:adenylate cyclase
MKRQHVHGLLLCVGVTLGILLFTLAGAFDSLELKSLDARFLFRGNRAVNPNIAVVAIDEASIAKLGRWPWPRAVHGKLVDLLTAAGAKVVAFDVLLTEPDAANKASDLALVKAASASDRVVSAFFFNQVMNDTEASDPLFPYADLADVSELGFVNFDPDTDGITRRASLYLNQVGSTRAEETGAQYPSLAVAAWAVGTNRTVDDALHELSSRAWFGSSNKILVNFAFDPQSPTGYPYPMYSYAEVLDGKVPLSTFKNKMVFVGVTAAGLFDLKAIPFISKHPGVMIHANILDNLIARNYLRESGAASLCWGLLALGLALGLILPRLSPWLKLFFSVGAAAVWLVVSYVMFAHHNRVWPVVTPLLAVAGCYVGALFYRLLIEEREKRKIKGSFKQYLSPKIIDVLTRDPSKLKLGGEEREVSIFFLDIAGFTTMSEALSPTQLVEVMNQCLTEFSGIILKHDGLINKYIGDCIMAFWNAPADQPNHAAQACFAALECVQALPELNRRFKERGLPAIDCRVGVNTGVAVVGNMGSSERFDYTVMGDAVNLASRLEGANKQYHTRIMISDTTFEKVRDVIEARDLDLIRVKGKKEPRKVFEVIAKKNGMPEEVAEGRKRYHNALSLYRQRRFSECIDAFETVFEVTPSDYVARVYLERARAFISHPPSPYWDGVYDMTTK